MIEQNIVDEINQHHKVTYVSNTTHSSQLQKQDSRIPELSSTTTGRPYFYAKMESMETSVTPTMSMQGTEDVPNDPG